MGKRLDLRGRTVLITGPARGIGAGLAREVARRGARPALIGIEPDLLADLAAEIGRSHGVETFTAEADVRDRDALDAAVNAAAGELGGIDVVVANAGVETFHTVEDHDPDEFKRVIDVNLIGVFNTLRATVPHVVARGGHLLPIASLAAATHAPGMSAYAASKAGCEAIADSLRIELAGTAASVGCGYFGFLDTDMVRDAFEREEMQQVREEFPYPISKVYPVQPAVLLLADGIEERRRVVAYPYWVRGVLRTRGVMQQVSEKMIGSRATEILSARRPT